MRLAIGYGTVVTRAVLAWPDGRWTHLHVDGSPDVPSGVYVDTDGVLWAGLVWRHCGAADPDGYVPYPKRHLTAGGHQRAGPADPGGRPGRRHPAPGRRTGRAGRWATRRRGGPHRPRRVGTQPAHPAAAGR